MKKVLLFLAVLGFTFAYAQDVDGSGDLDTHSQRKLETKSADGRLQGWYISGDNILQFNQAAFSNWVAGGVNSYALTAGINYDFNLTKGRHIWDNKIIMAYGVLKNEGEEYRKSNDVIDLTSAYGYEFKRHWYFAASLNFKTQFSTGYDYGNKDEVTGKYGKISNIMAPGYLTLGLGVDYKPHENFQFNFHPLTSRFIFVTDKDLQYEGNFGLKNNGDSFVYELGAFVGARHRFKVANNITYEHSAGIFSNYLDKPQNMVLAYQGVLDMKVSELISAQAGINLFYDENQINKMQVKETFGVGMAYKFNNTAKLKSKKENWPTLEELQNSVDDAQKKVDDANKKLDDAKQKVEDAKKGIGQVREPNELDDFFG